MKWSWRIGTYAGIDLRIHATFALIIAWVIYIHWSSGHDIKTTIEGLIFVLAIFGCVILHEFGHALTARIYGIKTKDITLLPIGGIARLEKMPDDPKQELWVALAGPAVNVVIAIIIFFLIKITGGSMIYEDIDMASGSFLLRLMVLNIILVVFNMLPAFPMDGGRVLRALLALRMNYSKATGIASKIGQAMAILFALIGIFYNPFLIFIAIFVWIGAAQEANMVKMKSSLWNIPVSQAMVTSFVSLDVNDTLARAVNLVLSGSQEDFPVVERGKVVGILTKNDLLYSLSEGNINQLVRDVMKTSYLTTNPHEYLQSAMVSLQKSGLKTIPVLQDNDLVGLLTTENLSKFLIIKDTIGRNNRDY